MQTDPAQTSSHTLAQPGTFWPARSRCVAHVDLDCFYASVEELEDPGLSGRPVAVVMGLDPLGRGAVATASYAARVFGVHSAQPLSRARQLCPDLVVLPVRHQLYREHSQRVMAVLQHLSPLFQQISIDEAFVELTNAPEPLAVVQQAARVIREQLGLPCSFGIATSKLVAKMATNQGKPRGFTVVQPGDEATFLASLAVEELWGVGPRTAERLRAQGLTTLGALARIDPAELSTLFGARRAMELHRGAQGMDDAPLSLDRSAKSISAEQTLGRGEGSARHLWSLYQQMAATVSRRLQAQGVIARTIGIKLRQADWRLVTRDRTLSHGTDDPDRIASVAADLMRAHWKRGTPLRLIGLRASGLAPRPAADQLPLF